MARYKMIGRDVNSSPTQYRTWVVNVQPDFDGYYYAGLKSGTDSFVNVSATEIQDINVVADFNLPDPLNWQTTRETLPLPVYNSQLAVIDGYVYLFGGEDSDAILRASLDNPATWEDTGAALPVPLGGSQLAIVDDSIYLFGGISESAEIDTIFQAPLSDPLSWTDSGSNLPSALRESQLGILDGYMYLFGGRTDLATTSDIFRASVSDPLTWIDTGDDLPNNVYGSHLGLLDGYFYLFGGLQATGDASSNILRSELNDPTNFSVVGSLPVNASHGQFFTIADKGYLITAVDSSGSAVYPYITRILECNLVNPLVWTDTELTISNEAYQSQMAIIYDRIFLFGGNGSSLILASNQKLKYPITLNSTSQIYGDITRTQYQEVTNPLDLMLLIGFPYWKTDYQF